MSQSGRSPEPIAARRVRQKRLRLGAAAFNLHYRQDSKADAAMLRQIFNDKTGYAMERWAQGRALRKYYENELAGAKPLIVDAGANIGASAVYFATVFPRAFVFAIEPEASNCSLFAANMATRPSHFMFQGALIGTPGRFFLRVNDNDSSHRVRRRGKLEVATLTPDGVLTHRSAAGTKPFIFKIDIEGSEADLFAGPTSWLAAFPCIIIELHDWMLPFTANSRNFITAVTAYNFDIVCRGEHLFCFNNDLLGHYKSDPDVRGKQDPPARSKLAAVMRKTLAIFGK